MDIVHEFGEKSLDREILSYMAVDIAASPTSNFQESLRLLQTQWQGASARIHARVEQLVSSDAGTLFFSNFSSEVAKLVEDCKFHCVELGLHFFSSPHPLLFLVFILPLSLSPSTCDKDLIAPSFFLSLLLFVCLWLSVLLDAWILTFYEILHLAFSPLYFCSLLFSCSIFPQEPSFLTWRRAWIYPIIHHCWGLFFLSVVDVLFLFWGLISFPLHFCFFFRRYFEYFWSSVYDMPFILVCFLFSFSSSAIVVVIAELPV